MTEKTTDEIRECMNGRGIAVLLSEEAASRIAWILTAGIAVLTLPFLALALMI